MRRGSFSIDITAWCGRGLTRFGAVKKGVAIKLMNAVVLSSPVGNPTIWKEPAPEGYVGGRFRANWNFSKGSADKSTSSAVDPTGAATMAAIAAGVESSALSDMLILCNSLPYAKRLEYDGWSSQAPAGMLRKNVIRFNRLIREEVAKAKRIR